MLIDGIQYAIVWDDSFYRYPEVIKRAADGCGGGDVKNELLTDLKCFSAAEFE